MAQTVEVPRTLFERLVRANEALNQWHEAFEGFLISRNPALLRKLRKARREHLTGKTRPLEEFKRKFTRSRASA